MPRKVCSIVFSYVFALLMFSGCEFDGREKEKTKTNVHQFNASSKYVEQSYKSHTAGLLQFWKNSDSFTKRVINRKITPYEVQKYMMANLNFAIESTIVELENHQGISPISTSVKDDIKESFTDIFLKWDTTSGYYRPYAVDELTEVSGFFCSLEDCLEDILYQPGCENIEYNSDLEDDLLLASSKIEEGYKEIIKEIDRESSNSRAIIGRKEAHIYYEQKATRFENKLQEKLGSVSFKTILGAQLAEMSYGSLSSSLDMSTEYRFDRYYQSTRFYDLGNWMKKYLLAPGVIDGLGGWAGGAVASSVAVVSTAGVGSVAAPWACGVGAAMGSTAASGIYDFYNDVQDEIENSGH